MRITSRFAVILGVWLFIAACGTENVLGICSSVLLAGFGTQEVIHNESM